MARSKAQTARKKWLERAQELPQAPGVYVMKDASGDVIYVGKAKDLKSRVRQYFQEGTSDYRAFIGLLGVVLADLETVVTRSEKEALLLEREMIRRHEPRFNVIWKDDKQYLCLRVDPGHEWPWVQVVRNMKKDGAKYFGPYHSASAARQTLRVVNRHFQLRTCRDSVLYNRTRPCLEYQIGRCPAPCVFEIDRDKYMQNVDDVLMFLDGKGTELAKRLETRMWEAAERTDYEVAAHYRDQLRDVKKTLQKQTVALPNLVDQDVYGLFREGADVGVAIVEVRGGRVRDISTNYFEQTSMNDADLLESTILSRAEADTPVPDEVVVPIELESADLVAELLAEKRGKKMRLFVPQRGDRVRMIELAAENAEHGFHEQRRKNGALERTLTGLRRELTLERLPARIECYDISNYQGEGIVASRVVFQGALPLKSAYRRYKIKGTAGQDDFASMYEVLMRRLSRGQRERDLPDLIVVDGGKGQLGSARAALQDLEIDTVDLVSLAKSRVEGTDADDAPTRSPERIFTLKAKDPIVLPRNAPELLLLTRIRDEAHRFAITYQRSLRNKSRLRSRLEDIPGVGPNRRRALLAHLGSLARVRAASEAELMAVPGIGAKAARTIWAALHPSNEVPESD